MRGELCLISKIVFFDRRKKTNGTFKARVVLCKKGYKIQRYYKINLYSSFIDLKYSRFYLSNSCQSLKKYRSKYLLNFLIKNNSLKLIRMDI